MSAYDDYEAFEYLDAGTDYEPFELPGEHAGEPYLVPLDEEASARAAEFIADNPVISLHEHTSFLPNDIDRRGEYTREGRVVTPYEYLAESPLNAAFVNLMGARTWDETIRNLGMRRADLAHQNFVTVVEDVDDLRDAYENGQFGYVLGVETSMLVENELDRLDVLYGLGMRTIGITYSESNALGTGLADQHRDGGLTKFGEAAVERMNKLGFLIDASHASNRTTLDVCEASEDPVVLSHNGSHELLPIDRLDPDEVLEAVAETGGVVGIQAAPHNTASPDHPRHSIESFMDHFEYVKDLVGIDHVTFGPDAMWGDHVALHRYFGKDLSQYPDWVDTDIDYVEGLENPNEAWTNVVRWLVREGYSDEEIRKVTCENTLRVLEAVW
ncbi:MAG: dipeptidase [Haloglomus sp.]